jgi:hypothetical protein
MGLKRIFFGLLFVSSFFSAAWAQNMNRYIVIRGYNQTIRVGCAVKSPSTPIRFETGDIDTVILCRDTALHFFKIALDGDTIPCELTIYGDITQFRCDSNFSKIIHLDVSQNPDLTYLNCSYNNLYQLDVRNNNRLKWLSCSGNNLQELDVSYNPSLVILECDHNWLSTLNLRCNNDLKALVCAYNSLTSLDLSRNPNLNSIYCFVNRLTSLDFRVNDKLTSVYCHANDFSTSAYDQMMCTLPERKSEDFAVFCPLLDTKDTNSIKFKSANAANARKKGWGVLPFTGPDVIETKGNYYCGLNMDCSMKLGVRNRAEITLSFWAANQYDMVRIVSGSWDTLLAVGSKAASPITRVTFTTRSEEVIVYGDVQEFICSDNGSGITALDVKNNPKLERLDCYGNAFSTAAFDALMCSLPEQAYGFFVPLSAPSDSNSMAFMASNAENAKDKGWSVCYAYSPTQDIFIPATSGTFDCTTLSVRDVLDETSLQVWPNPARTVLYLAGINGGRVTVYDLTGREIYRAENAATENFQINIAGWAKGMYFVRAGRNTVKVVKD